MSLLGLKRALAGAGIDSHAYRMKLSDLEGMPGIHVLHGVTSAGQGHFYAIDSTADARRPLVYDPRRKLYWTGTSLETAVDGWSGYVLTLEREASEGARQAAEPLASLVVEPAMYQLSEPVTGGEPVSVEFTLSNRGVLPVLIDSIRTSCACTTAGIELPLLIPPGETAPLPVRIRTDGKAGPFAEVVELDFVVETDGGEATMVAGCAVQGVVLQPFACRFWPPAVQIRDVDEPKRVVVAAPTGLLRRTRLDLEWPLSGGEKETMGPGEMLEVRMLPASETAGLLQPVAMADDGRTGRGRDVAVLEIHAGEDAAGEGGHFKLVLRIRDEDGAVVLGDLPISLTRHRARTAGRP